MFKKAWQNLFYIYMHQIMSMRCELTGKSSQTGNNVSHAKNRTKENLNLIFKTFHFEWSSRPKIQLRVAVSTIRTVEKKGGLDEFLINTPSSKLPLKSKKKKKQFYQKLINLKLWVISLN